MSINRLAITGYSTLELNRVSFPITGRVVADLPLNASFNTAAPAENGMILAVNFAAGEVRLPTGPSGDEVYALHFSPEREYDPSISGLNKFKLIAQTPNTRQYSAQGFYPRLGILSVAEKFTTNCLCYDTLAFANNTVALAALTDFGNTAAPVYGVPSTSGAIQLVKVLGTPGIGLKAIKFTTMPDGDVGVKFAVIIAQ